MVILLKTCIFRISVVNLVYLGRKCPFWNFRLSWPLQSFCWHLTFRCVRKNQDLHQNIRLTPTIDVEVYPIFKKYLERFITDFMLDAAQSEAYIKPCLFWPEMVIFHRKHITLSTDVVWGTMIEISKARHCRPIRKLSSFSKLQWSWNKDILVWDLEKNNIFQNQDDCATGSALIPGFCSCLTSHSLGATRSPLTLEASKFAHRLCRGPSTIIWRRNVSKSFRKKVGLDQIPI